ncbi:hypothetical protein CEXT_547181 [Caerostris extrusa]|uniref:Uncharacterized protein n=1 Tax=Caerostris extrusa TaxID=172846 RepID=A0AAV4VI48_CAEEX|nr:hypothetical protein CEXT_547181 [Caerostris extrusa]
MAPLDRPSPHVGAPLSLIRKLPPLKLSQTVLVLIAETPFPPSPMPLCFFEHAMHIKKYRFLPDAKPTEKKKEVKGLEVPSLELALCVCVCAKNELERQKVEIFTVVKECIGGWGGGGRFVFVCVEDVIFGLEVVADQSTSSELSS